MYVCVCVINNSILSIIPAQLFSVSLDIITNPSEPIPIRASGLLCLAELCYSLQAQALPYLPKFMPPLMIILKDEDTLKK